MIFIYKVKGSFSLNIILVNNRGITLVELLAAIVILGIIATIATPAVSNIFKNSRIKTEKTNAILLINMADLYFIENPHHDLSTNSVSVTKLMEDGYLQDINLVNDSFWIAEDKPSWICSIAYTKKNKVEFRKATIEMINNSGKDKNVGKEECGSMPAIP